MKIYRCKHCGNIIVKLEDKKVPVMCCGEVMGELTANSQDAAVEKHVPVVTVNDQKIEVVVGSTLHPMEETHLISWILLETEYGFSFRTLKAGEEPKVVFTVVDDMAKAVYAYCNLHGLWVKELEQ